MYTTGTGQTITTHEFNRTCIDYGCVIHCPTEHSMKDFPTHWRQDRLLMERICPHGVGHPDPDDLAFKKRLCGEARAIAESVHGCDGCCR